MHRRIIKKTHRKSQAKLDTKPSEKSKEGQNFQCFAESG